MSKIKTFKVADDNGNGNIKIIIDGKYTEHPNVISATSSKIETGEWDVSLVKSLKNNLIISQQKTTRLLNREKLVTVNYCLGLYALKNNINLEGLDINKDYDKINNPITIRMAIGYIAAELIKQKAMELEEELGRDLEEEDLNEINNLECNVEMATSIPVRVYTDEAAKNLAKKFKASTHELEVFLPKNKKCKVKINFTKVGVIPEASNTMYYLANAKDEVFEEYNKDIENEEDKLNKEFFRNPNNTIMHVAIGQGTTEFPRTRGIDIKEGCMWDGSFSTGTKNGIGHAAEQAIKTLTKIEGTQDIRDQKKISMILKAQENRFYDEIVEAIIPSLEYQANKILETVHDELNRAVPPLITVYGGGSILLREMLKPILEDEATSRKTKVLYIPAKYAVKLEAYGLYSYVNSKDFKDL